MKKEKRYLVPNDFMADPAVHVFNDRLYIYPSHDWESGIPENDNGDHFNMKDYHSSLPKTLYTGKSSTTVWCSPPKRFLGQDASFGIATWRRRTESIICISP